MPDYRRAFAPGGTFFFTLVTYRRAPFLCTPTARAHLREAIVSCRISRPFLIDALILLPDHLHTIWVLPHGDADFSTRWNRIKRDFTRAWLADGGCESGTSDSRRANRRRGVWQRRYWEHLIRDEDDYRRHLDYIHYNPVKHGLAGCPHDWPHSTFHQHCSQGYYAMDWMCCCDGRSPRTPKFHSLNQTAME